MRNYYHTKNSTTVDRKTLERSRDKLVQEKVVEMVTFPLIDPEFYTSVKTDNVLFLVARKFPGIPEDRVQQHLAEVSSQKRSSSETILSRKKAIENSSEVVDVGGFVQKQSLDVPKSLARRKRNYNKKAIPHEETTDACPIPSLVCTGGAPSSDQEKGLVDDICDGMGHRERMKNEVWTREEVSISETLKKVRN